MMTFHEALLSGKARLEQNGIDGASWIAERLLMHAAGIDRAELYSDLKRSLESGQLQRYQELLRKGTEHYPLAYLEEKQEFFGRDFYVNENVLIPRPETEEIIRAALSLNISGGLKVLDLGAGSGIIAATLAEELRPELVVGVEKSIEAISAMKQNSKGRFSILRADFFQVPLRPKIFDIITANPPYVEQTEYATLSAETRWEPHIALLTEDLEETYRKLIAEAGRLLKGRGHFIFEIGFRQENRISKVCEEFSGFEIVEIRKDYRDIARTFVLRKAI